MNGWRKPTVCADCPAPHPSFSLDGAEGPWRCRPCHDKAKPLPIDARLGELPAPKEPPQGRLL